MWLEEYSYIIECQIDMIALLVTRFFSWKLIALLPFASPFPTNHTSCHRVDYMFNLALLIWLLDWKHSSLWNHEYRFLRIMYAWTGLLCVVKNISQRSNIWLIEYTSRNRFHLIWKSNAFLPPHSLFQETCLQEYMFIQLCGYNYTYIITTIIIIMIIIIIIIMIIYEALYFIELL